MGFYSVGVEGSKFRNGFYNIKYITEKQPMRYNRTKDIYRYFA